jgi:K+/H+ antiporter YhaU regulatory subunit KhtT
MANNKLQINIEADTQEALKQMKEVTEAANECAAALEKLERLTNKFSGLANRVIVISSIAIRNHNHSVGSR